jgi:maleylpyruvate isomerase
MGGMSISPEASVEQNGVPAQRGPDRQPVDRATRLLPLVREATERLDLIVSGLDEFAIHQPSRLPGWSRAHVVTHLARNADALVNLLTWARTAASDRFTVAATELPAQAWKATVAARMQGPIPAANVPGMRLHEVWVHLVDLDSGFTFADIPAGHLEPLVAEAVSPHADRPDWPTVRLTAELPGGGERVWHLGGRDDPTHEVAGTASDALAWLTGRGDGSTLRGDVIALPAWG